MSTIAAKLQVELANLSDADRAELAHFLIQSLHQAVDGDAEGPGTPSWSGEEKRLGAGAPLASPLKKSLRSCEPSIREAGYPPPRGSGGI